MKRRQTEAHLLSRCWVPLLPGLPCGPALGVPGGFSNWKGLCDQMTHSQWVRPLTGTAYSPGSPAFPTGVGTQRPSGASHTWLPSGLCEGKPLPSEARPPQWGRGQQPSLSALPGLDSAGESERSLLDLLWHGNYPCRAPHVTRDQQTAK